MGKNSPIDWTDHLFHPWTGGTAAPSSGVQVLQKASKAAWSQPLKWNQEALAARRRLRVACTEPADLFAPGADPLWREEFWALVRQTPYLDWLLTTRHPEALPAMLPPDWGKGWPNVCLILCIENQEKTALVPQFLEIPARHRALALEPLTEPVKLQPKGLKEIDGVLAGGESGPQARPTHPDWLRSIRKQCEQARVRFFFKGWGSWSPDKKFAKPDGRNAAYFRASSKEAVILAGLPPEERLAELALRADRTFLFHTGTRPSGKTLDGRIYRRHPFGRRIPGREIVLPLAPEERHRLQVCEKTIREGLGTFVAVGTALMEIRDSRLYRQSHPSFESYVQSVLALTRPRAYQLIDSAQVMRDLSTIVDISALPKNEGQTRELCRWKTPAERAEKWKTVLTVAGNRPVTAKFIRQTLCPAPAQSAADPTRQAAGYLDRLRRLLADSPAESRALKLISKLEEVLTESASAPASSAAQSDFWLPGFGIE